VTTRPYRVLITGSRDYPTPQDIVRALNDIHDRLIPGQSLIVVNGACSKGADYFAHLWCRRRELLGDPVTEETHRAERFGPWPGCGPIRNRHMVSLGADCCRAFIGPCTKAACRKPKPHGSHGASGCADLAEAVGIPVRRFTP
jgi:hypothetical protein